MMKDDIDNLINVATNKLNDARNTNYEGNKVYLNLEFSMAHSLLAIAKLLAEKGDLK